MTMTTEERKAAAAKAAETRRRNAELEAQLANANEGPHKVDHSHGPTDHGAAAAHDTPREEELEWKRPSTLEAPPPRPGYVQRWIRTSIGASNDPQNVSKRFREGWRPRPADTVPRGYTPPTIMHGQYGRSSVSKGISCARCQRRWLHSGRPSMQRRRSSRRRPSSRMSTRWKGPTYRLPQPGSRKLDLKGALGYRARKTNDGVRSGVREKLRSKKNGKC
jgi:hypothetical protein